MMRLLLPLMAVMANASAMAADPADVPTRHALALYGEPALHEDFSHFPHTNPDAPVGGTLTRAATGSSFDSTNPYIVQGTPAAGLGNTYDTLLTRNPNEPFTMYGLLASGIRLDPQRHCRVRPRPPGALSRRHAGHGRRRALQLQDTYREGATLIRSLLCRCGRCARRGRGHRAFRPGRQRVPRASLDPWPDAGTTRPLLAGSRLHPTTRDALLGSGPYRIAEVDPGRRIVYERVDDYWGRDLPVNRGRHNIDRLIFDYYRDASVAMEAFKAGNLDFRIGSTARNWATGYDFPAANDGFVKRLEIPDGQPAGMQAYVMNLRRDKFQDVRLREA